MNNKFRIKEKNLNRILISIKILQINLEEKYRHSNMGGKNKFKYKKIKIYIHNLNKN